MKPKRQYPARQYYTAAEVLRDLELLPGPEDEAVDVEPLPKRPTFVMDILNYW